MTLIDYSCPQCDKLLFKGGELSGIIECKCERCRKVVRFTLKLHPPPLMQSDWHGLTKAVSATPVEAHIQKVQNLVSTT